MSFFKTAPKEKKEKPALKFVKKRFRKIFEERGVESPYSYSHVEVVAVESDSARAAIDKALRKVALKNLNWTGA